MLSRFRSLLTRTDPYEEYAPFILSRMNYISDGLFKHLSNKHYRWKENDGVKRFECLILAKFFVDYALLTTEGFSEDKRGFYLNVTDMVFEEVLKSDFPWLKVPDVVKTKLETYSDIMTNTPPPLCWQVLAGACTEIDYYSEHNQPTLTASSMIFPALFRFAQNLWEKFI